METLNTIRKRLRAQRLALDDRQQLQAASNIAGNLATHPVFIRSSRIAVYIPVAGEADPSYLVDRAWALGKTVYLPVLAPLGKRLWFYPFTRKTPFSINRFSIPEPDVDPDKRISLNALDLVLTPLVAFDKKGNRLGMGGGYYDNSFAFLKRRKHWHKPLLLGIAHNFQEVSGLSPHKWDIPLSGVVTDHGTRFW